MKKIFLITILAVSFFSACKKAEELRYASQDNIYLDLQGSERDSIIYSFAYNPGMGRDTVWIPVRISGIRTDSNLVDKDRSFILRAEKDSSTAIEGVHYEALDPFYHVKPGTGFTWVPVYVLNTDPSLEERSVTLHIRLYPTEDFGVNIPKLTFGKIIISNKLERPNWWGMWFAGYYSRVKHEFFLFVTGLTELSMDGLDAPKNLYLASLVTDFMSDPARWISKNPDMGYVLEPRPDGNYDFYNVNNPSRKVLYRKNPQTGLYKFIDEFGNEVQ